MTVHLADTPVLETDRLVLRAPGPQDWPAWRAMIGSERASFIGGPVWDGKAWRAFGHIIGHWVMRGYGSFVFTRRGDDLALGMTGPWYPAGWPEQELGWSVWHSDIEGQGLAFEAAAAARAHAFHHLGWQTAVSYIHPDNARSIALAERLGAVRDRDAAVPEDSEPEASEDAGQRTLVYRHPAPEGVA